MNQSNQYATSHTKNTIRQIREKSEKNQINDEWSQHNATGTSLFILAMAFCFWTINNNICTCVLWFRFLRAPCSWLLVFCRSASSFSVTMTTDLSMVSWFIGSCVKRDKWKKKRLLAEGCCRFVMRQSRNSASIEEGTERNYNQCVRWTTLLMRYFNLPSHNTTNPVGSNLNERKIAHCQCERKKWIREHDRRSNRQ